MTPTTIPEIITELQQIIDWSKQNNSRIGYFAVLYKHMTEAVQAHTGFADNERMERLVVNFANRYISSWDMYRIGLTHSQAWEIPFQSATNPDLIVLQHLILGINTHINYDLAIAAAETCPGRSIMALKSDFLLINGIIASLIDDVQLSLTKVWWPLRFLSRIANGREMAVLQFSLDKARQAAWDNAVVLATTENPRNKAHYLNHMQTFTSLISRRIISPGFFVSGVLRIVRVMESKSVAVNIELLSK